MDVVSRFFAEEGEDDFNAHSVLMIRTAEMVKLLDGVEQAGRLDEQVLARLRTLMNLTRSLLERHAEKEDKLIFPMVERALKPEQMDLVRARIEALPSREDLRGTETGKAGDPGLRGLGD